MTLFQGKWTKQLALLSCVIATVGALAVLWFGQVDLATKFDSDRVKKMTEAAGVWGPLLIVALMTTAIVASPLPSAPIATAAGAAYGHTTGTILVVAGAELGALLAFFIARILGRAPLERWLGERVDVGLLGSQNTLTAIVFGSRLLPFVSFDLVSYAAGLSAIRFWRFALATLAGIIPASFFLAHLGEESMSGDATTAGWTAALLGLFTLISIVWAAHQRRRTDSHVEESE